MDENNNLNEEIVATTEDTEQDKLIREAVEKMAAKIRNEALVQGAKMICNVVMDIMTKHLGKVGKKSLRDYERMAKEIYSFISVALQHNNAEATDDVTTEMADEVDVDNNND